MSTLKANNIEHLDANNPSIQTTIGGGNILSGVTTFTGDVDLGSITASSDLSIADKIVHTGDTNTSIRFPAADTFTVETAGSETLRINSSGNIGIGTDNPVNALLEVRNTSMGNIAQFRSFTGTAKPLLNITSSEDGVTLVEDGAVYGSIMFNTGSEEKVRINASGKVGIGTDNPANFHNSANQLVVSGADNSGVTIYSESTTGSGNLFFADSTSGADRYRGMVRYEHTDNVMVFKTNGDSERARIDSSGRVIVGHTTQFGSASNNPWYAKLQVCGDTTGTAGAGRINITTNQSNGDGTAAGYLMWSFNDGGEIARIQASGVSGAGSNDYPGTLRFLTNGGSIHPTERLRIDSSGRSLFGLTSSRNQNARIQSQANGFRVFEGFYDGNDADGPMLHLSKSRGTSTTPVIVSSQDRTGVILFSGYDGTNYEYTARIQSAVDTAPGSDDMPGRLEFATTANGSNTLSERMRIRENGRVIIGNGYTVDYGGMLTAVDESSNGTYFSMGRSSSQTQNVYSRDGTGTSSFTHIAFVNTGGERGSIVTDGSSTTYNTTSDYRIKENVASLTGAIDRVKQLAPKRFNFTGETKVVDGFLAHEAQTVVPEAVTGEKDAVDANNEPKLQGIDQSKLVPLLTAALQEAITKIETLEAKVAALEGS